MTNSPAYPLVSQPLVDPRTGAATRAFALFLDQLWQRTSNPRGNVIDSATAAASGAQVQADQLAGSLAGHELLTSAHGATGDVLGTGDAPTATRRGPVLQGSAVVDAPLSAVVVTSPAATAPGATYNQAAAASVADLANELRDDLGALSAEHSALAARLNLLLAALRAAGVIA